MELTIIRHGESLNNKNLESAALRVADPPLTDTGIAQAKALGSWLASAPNLEDVVKAPVDSPKRNHAVRHTFTHLYCSAMRRALHTASIVGEAIDMSPEVWVDIHEHGGIWLAQNGSSRAQPGINRSELQSEFPRVRLTDAITDRGWWTYDGEEDIFACFARASRVAAELRQRARSADSANDRIAIVSHGTFIDCLIKALSHRIPEDRYFHWHYNTGLTRFDLHGDGVVVLRYINRVTHLPAELVT
jgi:broad specificity phosphatase PhoE